MSAPPGFMCVCGEEYVTEKGLKQHQRRYCRGIVSNQNKCTVCEREFNSYAGMRLHLKKSHPTEYNVNLERESSSVKIRWTEDEENEIAKLEAQYEGSNILEYLTENSKRSTEAIKKPRQLQRYKDKVEQFRRICEDEMEINLMEEETIITENLRDQQEETFLRLENNIREEIINIPSDNLDVIGRELQQAVRHKDNPDIIFSILNNWVNSIIIKYKIRELRRNNTEANSGNDPTDMQSGTSRQRRARDFRIAQREFHKTGKDWLRRS